VGEEARANRTRHEGGNTFRGRVPVWLPSARTTTLPSFLEEFRRRVRAGLGRGSQLSVIKPLQPARPTILGPMKETYDPPKTAGQEYQRQTEQPPRRVAGFVRLSRLQARRG
jgi:hypothetical protein